MSLLKVQTHHIIYFYLLCILAIAIPVSEEHLKQEGLGEKFVAYLKRWPDLVK